VGWKLKMNFNHLPPAPLANGDDGGFIDFDTKCKFSITLD
jgi:hypothetical protein